jgi:hypothetical protein
VHGDEVVGVGLGLGAGEVRHLIAHAWEDVTRLIAAHHGKLDAPGVARLAYETLEQDEAYAG